MKEIGGYFEIENNTGKEFHQDCIRLNSGRNALRYLIRVNHIKTIYLPKFNCSVVSDVCNEEKVKILWYQIDEHFTIKEDSITEPYDYLYIINYYGQLNFEKILEYKRKFNNIIIDNAQSFFSYPCEEIDTLYTCRKFFGVPDGAYLYSNNKLASNLEFDCSYNNLTHLYGRLENNANLFYKDYQDNEHRISDLKLKYMSKSTRNTLKGINYDFVARTRTENFEYLDKKLSKYNKLQLTIPVGPYMYPLWIPNGCEIRSKLNSFKIYTPLLWPNVLEETSKEDLEYNMANDILPITCDQRYTINDMEYIVDVLTDLIEKGE